MKIPKKIRTELFHKLNIAASYKRTQTSSFEAFESAHAAAT